MTGNKLIEFSLFLSTLLGSFYSGTGFFVAMGGNPAIKLMTDNTFAEYWQHTDHFMAARMKIFGPLLLLSLLVSVIVCFKEYRQLSFWFLLTAFIILLADLVFVFTVNHPLNEIIQSWDLKHLPQNVQEVKWKVVAAFEKRLVFMIGSFVMLLIAVWLRRSVQK